MIFEKIVCSSLNQNICDSNILANEQYGFRLPSSSIRASYTLINEVVEALNNKNAVGGIFYDLRKAFDSVSHDIVL
jgi:hypothetical protein